MAGSRGARLQVGSGPWISEERSSALQIADSEVEEFSFSVRNDFDWLNEHMAEVFSENQINVAEIFKTPGKLRGKTPRTARKRNPAENRVPLSDIFSATPKTAPNPFALANLDRVQSPRIKIAADPQPSAFVSNTPSTSKSNRPASPPKPIVENKPVPVADSGYHGSQDVMDVDVDDASDLDEPTQPFSPQHQDSHQTSPQRAQRQDPAPHSPRPAHAAGNDTSSEYFSAHVTAPASPPKNELVPESTTPAGSPAPSEHPESPLDSPPIKSSPLKQVPEETEQSDGFDDDDQEDSVLDGHSRSPSDGSSPVRPVRKSSLNFASLPAREPMTHKRVSRTSHMGQNRSSYYPRHTDGKSLGRAAYDLTDDEKDDSEDDELVHQIPQPRQGAENPLARNKTYTQRLQDQISRLGQSQHTTAKPSKSITGHVVGQQPQSIPETQSVSQPKQMSSPKKPTTPGAFPEDDDDDDWIEPLGTPDNASNFVSPRPALPKSHSADIMEGLTGTARTVSDQSPQKPETEQQQPPRPAVLERAATTLGHQKSASVPVLPHAEDIVERDVATLQKTISASNPTLAAISEIDGPSTPFKSPTRSVRDSPLKSVKNKLSSILKSSRGLLASSAAISAESKASLLSPSATRLNLHGAPSTESLQIPPYPDLSNHAAETQAARPAVSPKRTRASIEKEKIEEKRKEKEAKEARRMAEQMEKLEKAREKEREKARVFSQEQERIAALEKQAAALKEQEKNAAAALATPAPAPQATRSSPRKPKQQTEHEERPPTASSEDNNDIDMLDAPVTKTAPSLPRAAPASATKGREIKRPLKPTKEPVGKPKQAPTVIRVNMGSQQHSQFHPSNSTLASNLQDTLGTANPQSQAKSKVAQPSLQSKQSTQNLKSSVASTGRPKALEMAARRKEQEEREAQRKRDQKAEMERKRAAALEEERRQEQQRKEAERIKEEERRQAEAKKAQRQAMIDKAKQTRAPPPAVRAQPNGPPDFSQKLEAGPPRPASRMTSHRPHEDPGRPAAKQAVKRPLPQETEAATRTANPFQPKESKRMRPTMDEFDDADSNGRQSRIKGAPVRPSGGMKKDMPGKAAYPPGYTAAPPSAQRDLFKSTLANQHNSQLKAGHPLDIAQFSKGAIPFNPAQGGSSLKTPARPAGFTGAAKSSAKVARSSPRFQNGESIELPEIDSELDSDDEDDSGPSMIAAWADSPNLRQALVAQETLDPQQIFGPPKPIDLKAVFPGRKDGKVDRFRDRSSSANWLKDRLTEDDIRKDMAARERMRRAGGWTYEMGRDLI